MNWHTCDMDLQGVPVSLTGGLSLMKLFLIYNWSIENSFSVKERKG